MKASIHYLVIFTQVFISCDNLKLDLQTNPNAISPDKASLNELYNSTQLTFSKFFEDASYYPGAAARMYYAFGKSYEEFARGAMENSNLLWTDAYAGLFPDIDALKKLSDLAVAEGGSPFDIHIGTAKIMKAYTMMVLVDLFGDVPYSEVGQGTDKISPKLDEDYKVYFAALEMLDEAISQLTDTNASKPIFDNFYNGDPDKWIKLANSLKLRAALNMGDATYIISIINEGNIITEESDDFQYNFGTLRANPPSRHPFYYNHYESDAGNYLSNYFMWLLRADKVNITGIEIIDPRIRYYFHRLTDDAFNPFDEWYCTEENYPFHYTLIDPRLPSCAVIDGYMGRDHLNGAGIPPDEAIRTRFGLYPAGGDFDSNMFEETRQSGTTGGLGAGIWPIMLSSFVDFMRAEAAQELGTGENPRALLESAIRKSLEKMAGFERLVEEKMGFLFLTRDGFTVREAFAINQARIDNYVSEVLALYDDPSANQLDIMIKEFYVAAWGNGLEAYNMYRRTGFPSNMQPGMEEFNGGPTDPFPRTFYYPSIAVSRNANLDQKPDLNVRVFWDPGKVLY